MQVASFNVNITSEKPEELFRFYHEIVELPLNTEMGDHALDVGGAVLLVDGHSETKGRTPQPQRMLLNFFVEDLAAEQARLEGHGVEFVRKAGKEYWGGVISTFVDPDGNYCQLIEYQPE
jgi:predicted enzyme related to lactoylglutathione lyase